MVQDSNIGTILDYAERIKERSLSNNTREKLRCNLWKILSSADKHLARFDMSVKRYSRATSIHDAHMMFVERENMLASLYETIDTTYITLKMIDFNILEVHAALDGVGIAGEDAGFVHEILDRLEDVCEEVAKRENSYNLKIDFSVPVDEREGVTFSSHPHWRDFVKGNIEKSFYCYFEQVQKDVSSHISQVPKFWRQRKIQHFFMKRPTLGKYIKLIMTASLGETRILERMNHSLTHKIEKHASEFIKNHWPIGRTNKNEQDIDKLNKQ